MASSSSSSSSWWRRQDGGEQEQRQKQADPKHSRSSGRGAGSGSRSQRSRPLAPLGSGATPNSPVNSSRSSSNPWSTPSSSRVGRGGGAGSVRILTRRDHDEEEAAVGVSETVPLPTASASSAQWPSLSQQGARPKMTMAERIKASAKPPPQQGEAVRKEPRILRQPVNLASESQARLKMQERQKTPPMPPEETGPSAPLAPVAERKELSEEERELMRQQRRIRRKAEKERKKKEREQHKRLQLYAPKTSKINFISSLDLQKATTAVPKPSREKAPAVEAKAETKVETKENSGKIRFMDEEYPDLGKVVPPKRKDKKEVAVVWRRMAVDETTGRAMSDAESGSEWETEPESDPEETDDRQKEENEETVPEVYVPAEVSSGISYSSILKNPAARRKAVVAAAKPKVEKKTNEPSVAKSKSVASAAPAAEEAAEPKKVKKADHITFDLFSALTVKADKKKQRPISTTTGTGFRKPTVTAATTTVLAGKIANKKKAGYIHGGNMLDSSAPTVRRGKEREKPKVKRKSKVKKIILAERERKKREREENKNKRLQKEAVVQNLPAEERAEKADEATTAVPDKVPTDAVVEESEPIAGVDADVVGVEPKAADETSPAEQDGKGTDDGEEAILALLGEGDKKDEATTAKEAENPVLAKAKASIHSRKFRDYCYHSLSPEIDSLVITLLSDVVRFQDKQHAKDPVKAKARRRYVVGIREAGKFINLKKVTLLLVAPDIERVESKGGLNDLVGDLVGRARDAAVPTVFCLNRHRLGRACLRRSNVSVVAVMNYQGTEENFNKMMALMPELKATYESRLDEALRKLRPHELQEQQAHEDQFQVQQPPPQPLFSQSRFPIEDPSEEIKRDFLLKIRGLMKTTDAKSQPETKTEL